MSARARELLSGAFAGYELCRYSVLILVSVVIFALCTDLYAGDEPTNGMAPLTADKESWRVGIAILNSDSHDIALSSISSLVPRLIMEEIQDIDEHIVSESERFAIASATIEKAELAILDSLADLHRRRDAAFFTVNRDIEEQRSLEQQISDQELKLSRIRRLGVEDVQVPSSFPLAFPDPPAGGRFWTVENETADSYRRRFSLDLLVIGDLVRVGDYYGIRLLGLQDSGETVLWEGAGAEGDLATISGNAAVQIKNLILGRPWAAITISTNPPSALITVDSELSGVGYWSDTTLVPGPVSVEISYPGFIPQFLRYELLPSERKDVAVTLEPASRAQTLVRSIPPGAGVRLGSFWMGTTPLLLDIPDRVMPLSFEMEGFRTRTVPFSPDSEKLTVPLDRLLGNPVDDLARSRKKLYNSIAWFSFSMAPTIVLLGVSQNYAYKNFNSTSTEDYRSSYEAYNLSYGLMWGSLAINAGLLVNLLFKLSDYLKSAEELKL